MRRLLPPETWPAALVTLVVLALHGGRAFLSPVSLALGGSLSEAPNHLWTLWAAAAGLFESGPFVFRADIGHPGRFESHLMDPANLLVFAPAYYLGGGGAGAATLAWNLLFAAAVVVSATGCWRRTTSTSPHPSSTC